MGQIDHQTSLDFGPMIAELLKDADMGAGSPPSFETQLAVARVWALLSQEVLGPQDEGLGPFDAEFFRNRE